MKYIEICSPFLSISQDSYHSWWQIHAILFLNDSESHALPVHSDHTAFMCSLIYFTTIPDALSVTLTQCKTKHVINSAIRPEISQWFSHTTQWCLSFLFLICGALLSLTVATVTRHSISWIPSFLKDKWTERGLFAYTLTDSCPTNLSHRLLGASEVLRRRIEIHQAEFVDSVCQ